MEKMEKWSKIAGYQGIYQVSDLGRVRSFKHGKTKVLKPKTSNKGYLRVQLFKDGNQKMFSVHRLVAMAFIPNPESLPQINHRNEIKTDNRVENLEWCNTSYNNSYGTRIQRIAESRSKPVVQLTLDGKFVKLWPSTAECGRNGFSKSHVAACCRGERKSHKGYIWMYADDFLNSLPII